MQHHKRQNQVSEEELLMQVREDLEHQGLLSKIRFACFSNACTAEQSRNNVFLSVLNKVFTVTSLHLYA